jgi:lysophospholipid acyltransferase (LPLAT)-like uncharacterized protein
MLGWLLYVCQTSLPTFIRDSTMAWNFFKPITKKIKNSSTLTFLLKNASFCFLRFLFATYRYEFVFDDKVQRSFEQNNGVFYFWHQQIVAALFFFHKMQCMQNCVVSSSRDGIIAGGIVEKLGFNVIYGSSFKNPIQLTRQALKLLSDGQQLCIVGDGSRGPAFELKQGIPYLAKKAKVPLFFVECASSWKITFSKSWDKFQIPLPFSKIKVRVRV